MDPRSVDLASLEVPVPRSLSQLSHPFCRLDALELEFVAPLGPQVQARDFVHLARG